MTLRLDVLTRRWSTFQPHQVEDQSSINVSYSDGGGEKCVARWLGKQHPLQRPVSRTAAFNSLSTLEISRYRQRGTSARTPRTRDDGEEEQERGGGGSRAAGQEE